MRFRPRTRVRAVTFAAVSLVMGGIGLSVGGTQQAVASSPSGAALTTTTNPIKHVVVILQENHSFDNVLGRFCTEVKNGKITRPGSDNGCDGVTTGRTKSGKTVNLASATDYVPTAEHSVAGQQTDLDGGRMDGFNEDPNCTNDLANCYNQYNPLGGPCASSNGSCIPNLSTLAKRYTVSDRTFEAYATPSWAGHLVWATANIDGFEGLIPVDPPAGGPRPVARGTGWGCDAGTVTPWGPNNALVPSCVPNKAGSLGPNWAGYTGTKAPYEQTIFDELTSKSLSWKIYGGAGSSGTGAHFNGTGWAFAICPTFAECLYTSQRKNLVPATNVVSDAANSKLPSFSIVTPTVPNSQHNNDDMSAGDNWIGEVISALQSSPEWSSTAVFVTYDDCGCFSDHVNPLQYSSTWGIRVPMVIVSPWAKAGYTDSNPTTFAGTLAYVEQIFGLKALDPTTDGTAYDYSGSFCYHPAVSGCKNAGLSPAKMVTQTPTAMTPAQAKLSEESGEDDT